MIQKVGIIGLGAIGILFAGQLQRAVGRENLYVIADASRIRRYTSEGIYANGEICEFRYCDPNEVSEKMDLLIFATKYNDLTGAIASAGSVCGRDTIVMSFLNGVGSEERIAEQLHPQHLLYSTVQGMDATKRGNHLTYTKTGSVTFGERDNTRSNAVCAVEELFGKAGIVCAIPKDIMHQLWSKWMLNVGVNQACAVYATNYGGVQKDGPVRADMIAAMEEARAVAGAHGILLTREELDAWVALIDTLSPEGEPSMRQDTRAGRSTEVGIFAGEVRRLGAKYGIATPKNDFFYEKLTIAG